MFSWTSLVEKVNHLLFNSTSYIKNIYDMYFNPNPKTLNIQMYDDNGALTNVNVPNMAKIKHDMWDAVNAATGLWNRTFYIDPVNGDDNNPGTSSAPFKTIAKAINATPTGGFVTLYLANNAKHYVNNINVYKKYIAANTWNITGSGNNAIIRKADNAMLGFVLGDSTWRSVNVDFENPYNGNVAHWDVMFKRSWYGFAQVYLGAWTPDGHDLCTVKTDGRFIDNETSFGGIYRFWNVTFELLNENPQSFAGITGSQGFVQCLRCTVGSGVNVGSHFHIDPSADLMNFISQSRSGNGYQKLPNGMIIQWGQVKSTSDANGYIAYTFPTAFPNGCLQVMGTVDDGTDCVNFAVVSFNKTSFRCFVRNADGSARTNAYTGCRFIAIGY